jgi:hypothetical protein
LAEKSYETASLGETSADEVMVQESPESAGGVDIYRDSDLSRVYTRASDLATAINDYETTVVEKYHAKDIFRVKGKSGKQISFIDLTLEENLSYVKYNLKDVQEAFSLFEITKAKFEDYPPYLSAAIVQAIAVKTRDAHRLAYKESTKNMGAITSTNAYKAMLK